MFESAFHRQAALALIALTLTSAVAGVAVAQTDVSTAETNASAAKTSDLGVLDSNSTAENTTVTIHHDGEQLVVPPASNVTIRGETTAKSGTGLTVVVKAQNGQFIEPERTTVREDGTFATAFDLRGLQFGTPVTVVTRTNDTVLNRETDARVLNRSSVNVNLGPSADNTNDPLVLHSAPNQTVHVETDAPAGTEMTISVRSTRFNFLMSEQITVSEDGSGVAAFDLSKVAPGATFTATASADAEAKTKGIVVNESATVHRDAAFTPANPDSNYTVRGQVMDSAVTELDVRVAPEGEAEAQTRTVTVGEDRTFAATFDFSSLPADTEVAVEVGGIPRSVNPVVVTSEDREPTVYAFVETPPNATIRYPEKTLLVHSASNQTVRGTTNLRPGTELTVKAVNDELNSPNEFTRTTNVTVGENGTFVAELNFSEVEPGTNFTVTVGRGMAIKDGRVVEKSVTLPTATTTDRTTTVNESGFSSTSGTTTDESNDGHADEFGVPGFGVPVALVALLAGLAIARRV